MNNRIRSFSLLCLLLSTATAFGSEEALLAVPVPDSVGRDIVAVNTIQHGQLLSIAHVTSGEPADSVIAFYREAWQDPIAEGLPGFIEDTAGDWTIISRPQDGWNQVVQMRTSSAGSEGRISVATANPNKNSPTVSPPMPSNAKLMSSLSSEDIGRETDTFTVYSEQGVQSMADFYRKHYRDKGWKRVSDRDVNRSQVILFQKHKERVEMVLSSMETGTLAVINNVAADE